MKIDLGKDELKEFIGRQLDTFYPDGYRFEGRDIDIAYDLALDRLEYCFKHISFPAYGDGKGQTYFSHMHSDQYSTFLYFLSNSLWKQSENKPICDKLIGLNKTLNGLFYSYKGGLPDIFFLAHPVGTIIGNAVYSDFLVIFQNVTINTDQKEDGSPAPELGKGLFLGAGAKIIGNKPVGDCVSIGVDAVVYNREIPDNSVVIKNEQGVVEVKERKKPNCMAQNYFNVDINSFKK
jgi:serine O-acetyltransferase